MTTTCVNCLPKFATAQIKSLNKFVVDYNQEVAVKLKEALQLTEAQVVTLTEALKVEDIKSGGRKGATKTRAPTAYNLFVQQKIKQLKAENVDMDRKMLMVQAAAAWTLQKTQKLELEAKEALAAEKASKKSKK
jgi:hypothetical protein